MGQDVGENCRPSKDFVRHIVNHVLSSVAEKLPISVFNELRARFSRAEEKYKFSIFGGSPHNLSKYLRSEDFEALLAYARTTGSEWVLAEILENLLSSYQSSCPEVAEVAKEMLEAIKSSGPVKEKLKITPEILYRALKMRGYKVSLEETSNIIRLEGPNFMLEAKVVDGMIQYTLCRMGKTTSIDALNAKIEKMREL